MTWIPGTKIIGHVVIGEATPGPARSFSLNGHGVGASSVSVGNLHGTCPNCLLVFVQGFSEEAKEWVASQDWIDLQTNSWETSMGGPVRDGVYAGSNLELQRSAAERGQPNFQISGNGMDRQFLVPGFTLLSSHTGPDWNIIVGGIEPDGSSVGHHRPVDISSLGQSYPSAAGFDGTVTAEASFDGTSNATPVVAGLYAEALYRLRRLFDGPSRLQRDGQIARGPALCAPRQPDCAMADGSLSVHELKRALFLGAQYTDAGSSLLNVVLGPDIPESENNAELEFASEGHGSYYGRLLGDTHYETDVAYIVDLILGRQIAALNDDQQAWMRALSRCRQSIWGGWEHGYYDGSNAPPADMNWPIRTYFSEVCPHTLPPLVSGLQSLSEVSGH